MLKYLHFFVFLFSTFVSLSSSEASFTVSTTVFCLLSIRISLSILLIASKFATSISSITVCASMISLISWFSYFLFQHLHTTLEILHHFYNCTHVFMYIFNFFFNWKFARHLVFLCAFSNFSSVKARVTWEEYLTTFAPFSLVFRPPYCSVYNKLCFINISYCRYNVIISKSQKKGARTEVKICCKCVGFDHWTLWVISLVRTLKRILILFGVAKAKLKLTHPPPHTTQTFKAS